MAKEKPEKEKKLPIPKTLAELTKTIQKAHGDGSVMMGRGTIVPVDIFPTFVATIDRALGCGGIPQGRIFEIFGWESSGKTTTCLQFIAACQRHKFTAKKRNGVCAFIDAEHAFDPGWAAKCGVNTDSLLFSQPDSGEEALDIVDKMADTGLIDLIVIDSVAALVPQAELDGDITENSIGGQARLLSKALRKLKAKASKTKTTIIFINQLRHKIGVMFGNPETTSGGNALKFYASIRAQVNKGSAIKDGDVTVAFRPTIKFIKNKVAAPFTSAEYEICVGTPERPVFGIDEITSLIEVGLEAGIIDLKGSSYSFDGTRLGQGLGKASAMVRGSEAILAALREKIYGKLMEKVAASPPVEPETEEDGEDGDEDVADLADDILDGDE